MRSRIYNFILDNYNYIQKIALFIIFIVLIVLLLPREASFKYNYDIGKPWQYNDLLAPFDFSLQKTESEIKSEQKNILRNFKPYFYIDTNVVKIKRNRLINDFEKYWELTKLEQSANKQELKKNLKVCLKIFDIIYKQGIIDIKDISNIKGVREIYFINSQNEAEIRNVKDFFTVSGADYYLKSYLGNVEEDIDRDLLTKLLEEVLDYNIFYDKAKTEDQKRTLIKNFSYSKGLVQHGEKIISRGELVTDTKYHVLNSLKFEFEKHVGSSNNFIFVKFGQSILIAVLMLVLLLFIMFHNKELMSSSKMIMLIMLLILIMMFTTSKVLQIYPTYIYIIPICLVAVITRIFFSSGFALFIHMITVILVSYILPNSFEYMFLQLCTGFIAVFSISIIKKRSQFFMTSLYMFISYSIIYTGFYLIQEGGIENVDINPLWKLGVSSILVLFAYPLVFIFEKIFGIVTDLTLIELADTNSSILKELSIKAPGTFQHSLQTAILGEEAIMKIGGNPVLYRVGALYHDIGKIKMPQYFIENQSNKFNPHNEISPVESSQIIISHVYFGIEIAMKNNLPESVIDFIRTHHGKTLTQYFLQKHRDTQPDGEIDMSNFEYYGPLPFSKETALLMIADSVEASSRTIREPNKDNIENMVDAVVNRLMKQNQFENTDLTFNDLNVVKKMFKKRLVEMYHTRIVYPNEG